ncbi:colicin E5-related ribonuclease [Pseudomonas fragi]
MSQKIAGQMGKRGWTENAIQSVIEIQQKLL